MDKLTEKENQIFKNALSRGDYFPSEFDTKLNTIQLAKIRSLKRKWGKIYLYTINHRPNIIKEYKKGIPHFYPTFALNKKDNDLIKLIEEYEGCSIAETTLYIKQIWDYVDTHGGEFFYWV